MSDNLQQEEQRLDEEIKRLSRNISEAESRSRRTAVITGISVCGVFLLLIAAWASTPYVAGKVMTAWNLPPKLCKLLAESGDTFGSVNALFTGLALGGVIATMVIQIRDLAYQRRTLVLQGLEMRAANIGQRESNDALTSRLQFEMQQAKKTVAYKLFDEFHGSEMHSYRVHTYRFLAQYDEASESPLPSEISLESQELACLGSARILHFFEKWGVLCEADEIDGKLAWGLLSVYFELWNDLYFNPLRARGKLDHVWQKTLDKISAVPTTCAPGGNVQSQSFASK